MSTAGSPAPSARVAATRGRYRQMVYGLVILLLFAAMYPYTEWLNAVKTRKELGEATLGEIDTGSFMLKLALLGGARGVAANVLWSRAIDLQKMHEWAKLAQTIDLITKLQPHFLSVWTFQGWNLAYNVSVEWDDPSDKYDWIKEGINFLRTGVSKNRRSPDLMWDTAWTYYHKLGFADESILLRRRFHDDDDEDFKLDPLVLDDQGIRTTRDDNFLLGYSWFTRAVRLVDAGQARVGGGIRSAEEAPETNVSYADKPVQRKGRVGDIVFRTNPAHAMTRYAIALEKMSIKGIPPKFGEMARNAWEDALAEWVKFGTYSFPAYNQYNIFVQIDDATNMEKFKTLHESAQYWTERWANDSNYRFWKSRCEAESQPAGVDARRLFYEATLALKTADYQSAAEKYKQGLELWQSVLKEYPAYLGDALSRDDIGFLVKRYAQALRNLDQTELPKDAPFYDVYEEVKDKDIPFDPHDALEVMGREATSERQ